LGVWRGGNGRALRGVEEREREINPPFYLRVFVENDKGMPMIDIFLLLIVLLKDVKDLKNFSKPFKTFQNPPPIHHIRRILYYEEK
jgi:hypothetical protein